MGYSEAIESGEIEAYVQSICALVGDREPIEVMAETPDALRNATQGLAVEILRQSEQEGKWSVLQVVRHLGDVEIAIGFRLRKIMAEPGCSLPAIDQDAWATTFDYNAGTVRQAIDDFEAVRKINLRLLRNTDASLFERSGIHAERGEESAARTIALYAGHDLYHLAQIGRIKKAIRTDPRNSLSWLYAGRVSASDLVSTTFHRIPRSAVLPSATNRPLMAF